MDKTYTPPPRITNADDLRDYCMRQLLREVVFVDNSVSSVDGPRHLLMRVVIIASSTPAWLGEGMKIVHIWNHGFLKRTYHLVEIVCGL